MTEFILNLIAWGGYVGIFILMTLENVFPPIPSEVIMGFGGMAVARGDMDMTPLLIVATLGTTAGNMVWYGIGRWIGIARLKPFVDRYGRWLTLTWDEVEQLNRFFNRHGLWVVFFFRFLPTFRTMISLPAGMAKMGMPRFLLATFVGSAIWNAVLAYAGLCWAVAWVAVRGAAGLCRAGRNSHDGCGGGGVGLSRGDVEQAG